MYIENHLLKGTFAGRSAKQLHCNKKSGLLEYPDMIVLHYTAGGNAMSSAHYLARADTDASAHLVIARDGGIIQLLPFDTIGWYTDAKCTKEDKANMPDEPISTVILSVSKWIMPANYTAGKVNSIRGSTVNICRTKYIPIA